jgi:hypothetical protein
MQHLVGARTLMGFLQSEINDHLPSTSSSWKFFQFVKKIDLHFTRVLALLNC